MCKFGLEITSVLSGTTCPVQVAQYDRYIQMDDKSNEYEHDLLKQHLLISQHLQLRKLELELFDILF